jgi:hypothetical protein
MELKSPSGIVSDVVSLTFQSQVSTGNHGVSLLLLKSASGAVLLVSEAKKEHLIRGSIQAYHPSSSLAGLMENSLKGFTPTR